MANQDPTGSVPLRGPVGFGNYVQGRKLRYNLSIKLVALAGALGDHPHLLGMGRHDQLGESRTIRLTSHS